MQISLQIRVLGPVSIVMDGRQVPLGYAKQRCVLAMLALEAGTVVTPERIIDRVWGAHAPASTRGVLYGHMARLRRTLRESGSGHGRELLLRRSGGYLLDVTPEVIDLYRFRALACRAREAGDGPNGAALWQEALGLWRGTALSCVDGTWVQAMRVSLERERLSARLNACDAQVRMGLEELVLPELEGLAGDHPLHEGIAARLMLALYRTGHAAAALEHFDSFRRRLAQQLGTDPGPELIRLQLKMLRREIAGAALSLVHETLRASSR